jgi:hypothetical protein
MGKTADIEANFGAKVVDSPHFVSILVVMGESLAALDHLRKVKT